MYTALKNLKVQQDKLPSLPAKDLLDGKTALIIVDMVNGFLTQGSMASLRCAGILASVEKLLALAAENGIPTAAFADCHETDCAEFAAFPAHCVRGTAETEIAPELRKIGGFERIEKNSTNGFLAPGFQEFLQKNQQAERFLVCGVCTDICVMQFALTLQTYFNQEDRKGNILVPANAVETYDAPGHNGDLMQLMGLQMMAQAGITILKEVES